MPQRIVALILAITIVFSPFLFAQTPSGAPSGVEGVITVRPAGPGPEREGEGAAAVANSTFVVESKTGPTITFTTDAQGRFRILLEPGHYTIALQNRRPGPGHFGPWQVDVLPGRMTKVAWQGDSGMR